MEEAILEREAPQAQEHQTVVFRLETESFGVDIFRVNEIIRMREVTPVPGSGIHIRGLINLRGKTIPVVDLRSRLGLGEAEATDETRIIVVSSEQGQVGLVVDAVTEVMTLAGAALEEAPALVADTASEYVWSLAKHNDRIITLLDLDKTLAA